jgi:hypothetical protein
MKRLLMDNKYDLLTPKRVAGQLNPEDVISEHQDPRELLEVLNAGLKADGYWDAWERLTLDCIVDDPAMGYCELLEDNDGVWLHKLDL